MIPTMDPILVFIQFGMGSLQAGRIFVTRVAVDLQSDLRALPLS